MKSKGFTLIEIIVSLAIFSVVAVIAIGALVRVTSANRQAQAIQSGVNNVSFILDAMSREMRVGTGFKCFVGGTGQDLTSVSDITSFGGTACGSNIVNDSNDTVIYFTSSNVDSTDCNLMYAYVFHVVKGNTQIEKGEESACGKGIGANLSKDHLYPITSSNVAITNYSIGVFGTSLAKGFPWVFIRLQGYVGTRVRDQSVFDVQTSISQRTSI
jgi:prepilin-type N-terminal cleavage/methylation domain-containing protein